MVLTGHKQIDLQIIAVDRLVKPIGVPGLVRILHKAN